MAQFYEDAHGIIELEKQTGLIRALFGALIGEQRIENGKSYVVIDYSSEGTARFWSDVIEDLLGLVRELGLPITLEDDNKDDWLGASLEALTTKYGCSDPDRLNDLIEHVAWDDSASLESLFEIATFINDGHGIQSMTFESAYTFNIRKQGAFGGDGVFSGQHFTSSFGSKLVHQLGQNVETMLSSGDTLLASRYFKDLFETMLGGIRDEKMREEVRAHLFLKDPHTETD